MVKKFNEPEQEPQPDKQSQESIFSPFTEKEDVLSYLGDQLFGDGKEANKYSSEELTAIAQSIMHAAQNGFKSVAKLLTAYRAVMARGSDKNLSKLIEQLDALANLEFEERRAMFGVLMTMLYNMIESNGGPRKG